MARRKKVVQATTDVNNDGVVDEKDTIEVVVEDVQADYDVNNDGVVDEKDTIEVVIDAPTPKTFGYVVGKPASQQLHPDKN
jgi:hypothetical protein